MIIFLRRQQTQKIGRGSFSNCINRQAHEYIEIPYMFKATFTEKCLQFYKEGLTFQEIAIKVGRSKSSVRTALFRKGVDVFPDLKIRDTRNKRTPDNWFGVPPYGFVVVRAKLERHPKEFAIARMIIDLWQQGVKYEEIAQRLNDLEVKPRKAAKWERTTIRELVRRHQEWPGLYGNK